MKRFFQTMLAALLLSAAAAQAAYLPLNDKQIADTLSVQEQMLAKSREFWNDPAQKKQLEEEINKLATKAKANAAGSMLFSMAKSALISKLPPQAQIGLSILQSIISLFTPKDDPAASRFDYEKSNLPRSVKDLMRTMEKGGFDAPKLSASVHYVFAGYWKLVGDTPELNAANFAYVGDATPRGVMMFALDSADLIGEGTGDADHTAAEADALLEQAARDVKPYRKRIEAMVKTYGQK